MADDSHENGTSNGDVPEIELIIKLFWFYFGGLEQTEHTAKIKIFTLLTLYAMLSSKVYYWIEITKKMDLDYRSVDEAILD
ncbi:hypothetical protein E2986_08988 [Frieseomelitta varia]|uniref:Uncharacterized protein n=1 Tax=Frieseomelitta varia TaxID=561572 RepID=A0A833WD01_9HYME|nr:hypothetical protein E2986_08988 [Frieseomelitta varia]